MGARVMQYKDNTLFRMIINKHYNVKIIVVSFGGYTLKNVYLYQKLKQQTK